MFRQAVEMMARRGLPTTNQTIRRTLLSPRPTSSVKRWISSTAVLLRNETRRDRAPPKQSAIRNDKLVKLGRKKNWNELLAVAEKELFLFDTINFATVLSQLARIRSFDKMDKRFLSLLKVLVERVESRGMVRIYPRHASNILHSLAKMKLTTPMATKMFDWISSPDTAVKFAEEGNPHDLANAAWACAKLNYSAPTLFSAIDRKSNRLFSEGMPQSVSNIAWAHATLGLDAPNVFAAIERNSKWIVE